MPRREREAPELAGAARRMFMALVRRCGEGELEALESLIALNHESATYLGMGVRAYRAGPAQASWTEIAHIHGGMTRQGAQQRWSAGTA